MGLRRAGIHRIESKPRLRDAMRTTVEQMERTAPAVFLRFLAAAVEQPSRVIPFLRPELCSRKNIGRIGDAIFAGAGTDQRST